MHKRYSYCTCGHTYWQHSDLAILGIRNRCLKCEVHTWHEFKIDNLRYLENKSKRKEI